MTEDGIIKGLKKGITTIYFNDIYNQYYNNITVIVNKDEVLEEFINSYKDKTIYVNQKDFSYYNRYDSENSDYYYGYDFESEVGNANEDNYVYQYYYLYPSRDINCDKFDETGVCTITFTSSPYDFEDITFDVKVIKEGIYLEEKEKNLSVNEEYTPKYTLYNTEGIEIKSLNTDVCIVEDNKIKGINTGMCNVLFTSGEYFNYMHFVVDIDGFNNLIKEEIDNLPSVYDLKMDEVDFSIVDNYDTELVYNTMNRIISDSVTNKNLGEFYFTFTDNAVVSFFVRHYGYLNFYDSKTDYSYTYYLTYNKIEIAEKEIEINYTGYTDEEHMIIEKIDKELEKKYNLTLSQYITYELNKKEESFYEMFEYTEFYNKLDEICNGECEIEIFSGYGCDIPGNVFVGIGTLISYKGKPIYVGEYEVKNTYTIEINNNISEEVFIEKIKDDFKNAYNTAKENIKNLNTFRSYNITNLYSNITPPVLRLASDEVTVKKGFNKELLLPEYTLSIEDYTMTLVVNTFTNEELVYNTKLIDYELNTYDISLDIGSKKQIDITFNPSNATNREVSYKSMNEKVATVNDGLITAVKEGNTIIQVISKDGNITKEIKVVVNGDKNVVLGDVTGDGIVNISDLVTFRKYLANKTTINEERLKNIDLNNDGKINITDLIRLRKMLAK